MARSRRNRRAKQRARRTTVDHYETGRCTAEACCSVEVHNGGCSDSQVYRAFRAEIAGKVALSRAHRGAGRVWSDWWTTAPAWTTRPGKEGFNPRSPLAGADLQAKAGSSS